MKRVIILRGLPSSGKTTWAKNIIEKNPGKYKRINKDDIRVMLDGGKWSRDNEKFVINVRDDLILKALEDGKHVIVDDTNLHPKHETRIKQITKGLAEIEVKEFDANVKTCIKFDLKRQNSVGEKVIRDMYNQFLKPEPKKYKHKKELSSCIVCDIDGTLALMKDRTPFEFDKVMQDEVNEPVAELLRNYDRIDISIIIATARDGMCENITHKWLSDNDIPYDLMIIKETKDNRKDAIVKKEILEKIKENYNILFWLDDRDQVVEMLRDEGVTCFQVAYGDF